MKKKTIRGTVKQVMTKNPTMSEDCIIFEVMKSLRSDLKDVSFKDLKKEYLKNDYPKIETICREITRFRNGK